MAGLTADVDLKGDNFLTGWRWPIFGALTLLCLLMPKLPQIAGLIDRSGVWRRWWSVLYQPHLIGTLVALALFGACFAMLRANSAVVSEFLYWDF